MLLKHPKFSEITIDMNILNEIILCKAYLKLDLSNNTITLNIKIPRDVLIIRDLPDGLSNVEETLMNIFNETKIDITIINISPQVNNIYYIHFGSETEARQAFLLLKGREIMNHNIKCELKTNMLFRTTNFTEQQKAKETKLPP